MPCNGPALPSSHRTCRFPASGVPRYIHRRRAQGVASLLGLLVQRLPQKREFLRDVGFPQHILGLRCGISSIQAVLPSSCRRTYLAGSLRSTDITPLPRYYEPRRLPIQAGQTVMDSRPPLNARPQTSALPVGSPRFLAGRSARAVPNHPGEPDKCTRPLLPCRWQASPLCGGLAAPIWCYEAETGSLYYGSHFRRTRLRTPDCSDARSFGYMSNGQFTWQAPLSLQDLPSFAWRTTHTLTHNRHSNKDLRRASRVVSRDHETTHARPVSRTR